MNKLIKLGVLASLAGVAGQAYADAATTNGGLKVKTDDGRFEMSIGGRFMYDIYLVESDDEAVFGSGLYGDNASGGFFRRARLTFKGKAYGWEYEFVPDFSQNTGGIGSCSPVAPATTCDPKTAQSNGVNFQELYAQTKLGPGTFRVGQFKPFRSMEELTSSNEITMMERPFSSASGLYESNQFVQGFGYMLPLGPVNIQADLYNLRKDNGSITSGIGGGLRVFAAPLNAEGSVLHVGISGSQENPENGEVVRTGARYAGRRGANAGTLTSTVAGQSAMFYAAELAAAFGPFYAQAEYGMGSFDQADGANPDSLDAAAYHLTLSFFLTGETKPYDAGKGVFKSPKPKKSIGAFELTARYESIEDSDEASAAKIETVNTLSAGANWYVNPNVRFMLNYNMGSAELVNGEKDEPNTLALRTQIYW